MTYAYSLATLRVESALELPELTPWQGPDAAPPDIVFRLGSVPPRLERTDRVGAVFQARGRDEFLLTLPEAGRILVCNGREVTIEMSGEADLIGTRALLTGPVQALLWHQRGLLPLHANGVVVGGRAVLLAGPSAAGKSALAAVLAGDGCEILADDVCAVELREAPRRAMVLPGVTMLRLWHDTLDHLGISPEGLRPVLSDNEKFFVDRWRRCSEPRELAAVIVLVRRTNIVRGSEQLHGPIAENAVRRVVHTRRPARALCREEDAAAAVTRMLLAGVTVWRLSLPDDLAGVRDAAAKVRSLLEQY